MGSTNAFMSALHVQHALLMHLRLCWPLLKAIIANQSPSHNVCSLSQQHISRCMACMHGRHEGGGSLFAELKARNLANSLVAGEASESFSAAAFFMASISLTDAGQSCIEPQVLRLPRQAHGFYWLVHLRPAVACRESSSRKE